VADVLSPEQLDLLGTIAEIVLTKLDDERVQPMGVAERALAASSA
jgi:hypothetical protein